MLLAQVLVPLACTAALLLAVWLSFRSTRVAGHDSTPPISRTVVEATGGVLVRQYSTILFVALPVGLALGAATGASEGSVEEAGLTALAFVAGTLGTSISGFVGTSVGVRVSRSAAAAASRGAVNGLQRSFQGGGAAGLVAGALCLGGTAGLFGVYSRLLGHTPAEAPLLLAAFAFGASLTALIANLGGGTFARASHLAAMLVGKLDPNVPDRDARNPAVVADLAGEHLGDGTARGSEFFEMLGAATIGALMLGGALFTATNDSEWALLPLVLPAFGLLATALTVFAFPWWASRLAPTRVFFAGFWLVSILSVAGLAAATYVLLDESWPWYFACGLVGIGAGIALTHLALYYTSGTRSPSKDVANATEIGTGPGLIMGTAVGLEATAVTALVIGAALFGSFRLGQRAEISGVGDASTGLFGVAVAALAFLMAGAYVHAVSSTGAIAASAAGLIELSGQAPEASQNAAEALTSATRSARAATRGFTLGGAAFVALLLISSFLHVVRVELSEVAREDPQRFVQLSQKLGFFSDGLDVQADSTNALLRYVESLESCGLPVETVAALSVADRFEARSRMGADEAGGDCLPAASGSPAPLPAALPLDGDRAEVVVGAMAGLAIAIAISSFAIRGVWATAGRLVQEVRRQFRPAEAGTPVETEPDYARAVAVTAAAAYRQMARPIGISMALFLALGLGLRFAGGESGTQGWLTISGALVFGAMGAVLLSAYFSFAGGALANSSAVIAAGFLENRPGGPASQEAGIREAVLAADIVGEPLRGTAAPALTVAAKLLGTLALALAPLLAG